MILYMMNLKFIDFVSRIWGLIFRMAYFSAFGLETLIIGITEMKQNVFGQTFSGWDCKSQETRHSSKEYEHRIAQTATKPNPVKHFVKIVEISICNNSHFCIFFSIINCVRVCVIVKCCLEVIKLINVRTFVVTRQRKVHQ